MTTKTWIVVQEYDDGTSAIASVSSSRETAVKYVEIERGGEYRGTEISDAHGEYGRWVNDDGTAFYIEQWEVGQGGSYGLLLTVVEEAA